jgi:hypothetical protein
VFDPASASITGTPVTAVTASLTVVLTDAYGSSVTHTLPLLTAAAPAPPVSVEAPKLSALKQSVRRWVLGTKLSRLVASVPATVRRGGMPVGTTFSFRLDQSAQVTLTFRHATQGRRVAGKCVVRTRSNAAKPHCTRTLTDGTIRVNAAGGNSRLRFDGRVNSMKKLTSRSYSVAVSAKNAAGKTSTAQVLHFTIAPG